MDPLDLTQTSPGLNFTRWIKHFCAPLSPFLAVTGVFPSASRGRSKRELSWFLITRGLWLIILDIAPLRCAWTFNFSFHVDWDLVLWALGCSMLVLAALILPYRWFAGLKRRRRAAWLSYF